MDLSSKIRTVKDFPGKGATYRDLTPIYQDPEAFKQVIEKLALFSKSVSPTKIVAMESSGFLIGAALAHELGIGMALVRRYGRLPYQTLKVHFTTEYRDATLEIGMDALKKKEKVLIVDDLIATGGALEVVTEMVERLGAQVAGIACIAELEYLNAREKLGKYNVHSLVKFKSAELASKR